MKYLILVSILLTSLQLRGQTPPNDPYWQLAWEDNFNFLDENKWKVEDNFDGWGGIVVFNKNNVYIENGSLICEIKNQNYYCPTWAVSPNYSCITQYNTGESYVYTSGWIESKQPYNIQYGYIEARIKFPFGNGDLWPAFWTFQAVGGLNATNDAEIDIAEMLGETGVNTIQTNIHYINTDNHRLDIKPDNGYDWRDWHVYGVEWSPSKIIWYLDGYQIRKETNHSIVDPIKLILNVGHRNFNLGTVFPQKMYVDYIKVYSHKKNCNVNTTICDSFWLPTIFSSNVVNNATIGNGSCSNVLFSNLNIILKASQGVMINGDFEIQQGGQLYIDGNGVCP